MADEKPAYELQVDLPDATVARIRNAVATRLHADGSATPASIITDASGRILATRWGVPTLSELKRLRAKEKR